MMPTTLPASCNVPLLPGASPLITPTLYCMAITELRSNRRPFWQCPTGSESTPRTPARPRAGNGNTFAESALRTANFRFEYVRRGFRDVDQARARPTEFVTCYAELLNNGVRKVSRNQGYAVQDRKIVAARHRLQYAAQAANRMRRTRNTRN